MTPHFDNTTDTDVTATVGRDVFLPCSVRHLGDRTVSWIRRPRQGIFNVLAVGRSPYTADGKFQPMHLDNSESWNLQIKDIRPEDAGVYECQVSTTPKISRHITLSVIESRARILGSPVLYVNQGGVLRLVCELSGPLTAKEFIFWYRNGRVLNYDSDLRKRMEISSNSSIFKNVVDKRKNNEQQTLRKVNADGSPQSELLSYGNKLKSRLVVTAMEASDSGNYTCQPSNALPDSIQVFVIINNDLPAAMQDSVMEISATTGNNVLSHTAVAFMATALPSLLHYFFGVR
ncbi:Down syndrome cell adhesion molecule-like [Galendromus occidentalis]|uniref:Down syndrome cell adhesion molecule-like n=1 Tax=Galendromus occidentalis TaxID=34638 RepID=A0AAJ7WHZ7_9ACAR|nr:Down syndrome cell adhesion molecule-like [Galendromus occidentalis]